MPEQVPNKFPIQIEAYSTVVKFSSKKAVTDVTFCEQIKSQMLAAGWSRISNDILETGIEKGYDTDTWYEPKIRLKMIAGGGGIDFEVSQGNNAFAPTSPVIRIPVGGDYLVLTDPYSVHLIYKGGASGFDFGRNFSFSNVHLNYTHRSQYRVSANVYATNGNVLRTGASDQFGLATFAGRKSELLGNFSWMGGGIGSVRLVTFTTADATTMSFDNPHPDFGSWISTPVYIGWGQSPNEVCKIRGFLWNMKQFVGTLEVDEVYKIDGNSYYILSNYSGVSLGWRIV